MTTRLSYNFLEKADSTSDMIRYQNSYRCAMYGLRTYLGSFQQVQLHMHQNVQRDALSHYPCISIQMWRPKRSICLILCTVLHSFMSLIVRSGQSGAQLLSLLTHAHPYKTTKKPRTKERSVPCVLHVPTLL